MEYNEHARIHSPRAGTETKSFSLSFSRGFTLSLASFFFLSPRLKRVRPPLSELLEMEFWSFWKSPRERKASLLSARFVRASCGGQKERS